MTSPQNKVLMSEYPLYTLQLLFNILKPVRLKYKLSINVLIVLNSCYLYSKLYNEEFYITQIREFLRYYDANFIRRYFKALEFRGCIARAYTDRLGRDVWTLTPKAHLIIQDIERRYEEVMYLFFEKHNMRV